MHICPLCQSEFETPIKLGNHFKSGDIHHKFLRELIKLDKKSNKDFQEVFENHKDLILNVNDLNESIEEYKNVLQQKKNDIQKQKEEEKLKKEQLKIEKIEAKKLAKLEKQKREAERYKQMIEASQFKKKHEKKFVKDLDPQYKPMNLAKYFYDLVDVKEFNGILATSSIKSLYFKYQLEPEQVKKLLKYAAETGHSQISEAKFLIEEADRFYQYANQIRTKKTVPYLIKMFYDLKHSKIDKKTFVRNVDRVKSLMKDNEITFDEAENIISYMAKANVNSLFWFNDYISVARPETDVVNDVQFDDNEIGKIVNEVMSGDKKYTDISIKISFACFKKIKEKIMSNDFDKNYNYSEFLYKIQMVPDKELIKFISEHNDRQSRFQTLFDVHKNDDEILEKIKNEYEIYKKWAKAYQLID